MIAKIAVLFCSVLFLYSFWSEEDKKEFLGKGKN